METQIKSEQIRGINRIYFKTTLFFLKDDSRGISYVNVDGLYFLN